MRGRIERWSPLIMLASLAIVALLYTFLRHQDRNSLNQAKILPDIDSAINRNEVAIKQAIEKYDAKIISVSQFPWSLFHGLLGNRGDFAIYMDQSATSGKKIECREWLLTRASYQPLYLHTSLVVQRDWGVSFVHDPFQLQERFEDHFCQFLFILMETTVDPDHTCVRVTADGHECSLREMVRGEQRFCNGTLDVSWAMPVFARWGDDSWVNKFDERFDFERLMKQHLALEAHCTACFGAHWRMGLAYALRYADKRLSDDLRQQAQDKLAQMVAEARTSQDGSGRFDLRSAAKAIGIQKLDQIPSDLPAQLSHQGHTLEWLMYALSDKDLASQLWPHQGIRWLLDNLGGSDISSMNYGAYCHCIDALRLYQQRLRSLQSMN